MFRSSPSSSIAPLCKIASPLRWDVPKITSFNAHHSLLRAADEEEVGQSGAGSPLLDLLELVSRELVIDRSVPATPPGELRVGVERLPVRSLIWTLTCGSMCAIPSPKRWSSNSERPEYWPCGVFSARCSSVRHGSRGAA